MRVHYIVLVWPFQTNCACVKQFLAPTQCQMLITIHVYHNKKKLNTILMFL